MLTIIHNATCTQVVRVSPVFYLPLVFGKGKNKRVITAADKCLHMMIDLNGIGFNLVRQEKSIATGGNTNPIHNKFDFKKSDTDKIHLKKMKYYFRKDIKAKYPSEKEMTAEQLFKKHAQKIIHSNSETWVKN